MIFEIFSSNKLQEEIGLYIQVLDGIQTEEIAKLVRVVPEGSIWWWSACVHTDSTVHGAAYSELQLLTGVTSQLDAKPVFKRQIQFRV